MGGAPLRISMCASMRGGCRGARREAAARVIPISRQCASDPERATETYRAKLTKQDGRAWAESCSTHALCRQLRTSSSAACP